IQRALESAGVVFVQENGEGPGVRLKKGFATEAAEDAADAALFAERTAAVREGRDRFLTPEEMEALREDKGAPRNAGETERLRDLRRARAKEPREAQAKLKPPPGKPRG